MKAAKIKQMSKEAVNQLIESIEKGQSEQLKNYLKAMAKFHKYSPANAMLIYLQKPQATHVAGFHTWKKLKRRVKKGEHGIAIMAPVVYHKKLSSEDIDDEELNKLLETEEIRTFKAVFVFDISQTIGMPLPEFAQVRGDPVDYTERLKEYITSRQIKIEYSDKLKGAEGVSCGGRIFIREGLSPAQELSVVIHEFAHEILHSKRFEKADKNVRETEAEAVAFVVCSGLGLDVNTASSDYIQLYNGDRKTLMDSLTRIQNTASQILEAVMDNKEADRAFTEKPICAAPA